MPSPGVHFAPDSDFEGDSAPFPQNSTTPASLATPRIPPSAYLSNTFTLLDLGHALDGSDLTLVNSTCSGTITPPFLQAHTPAILFEMSSDSQTTGKSNYTSRPVRKMATTTHKQATIASANKDKTDTTPDLKKLNAVAGREKRLFAEVSNHYNTRKRSDSSSSKSSRASAILYRDTDFLPTLTAVARREKREESPESASSSDSLIFDDEKELADPTEGAVWVKNPDGNSSDNGDRDPYGPTFTENMVVKIGSMIGIFH